MNGEQKNGPGGLPGIAITMGDPAGIGPELCLRAIADTTVLEACHPLIFGDASILSRVSETTGISMPARIIALSDIENPPECPAIVDCGAMNAEAVEPGCIKEESGHAVYRYIESGLRAVQTGRATALVTAPINKESLRLAGIKHPGHTEILAELTGTKKYIMMMASDQIVIGLVTIHTPYAAVPKQLSVEKIATTIDLTHDAMLRLGKKNPHLTICGLNPHAGEHGLFGDEEEEIIEPAITEARNHGLLIEGPLPADTAFIEEKRRCTDAYIVMYHDQGLIPFKMLAFDRGVNITLGLPVVRTSVDHGTAFDIAWQGKASPTSLIQAILWALRLRRR